MTRTTKKVIGLFAVFFIFVAGIKGFQIYLAIKYGQFTPPPEAVTTAIATKETWSDTFHGVGSIESIEGALLSSQEAGTVARVLYEPGSYVEAGTVLVEIDSNVEIAQLNGAVAYAARMKKAYDRVQALKSKGAISNDEYDNTVAEYERATSAVDSLRATIGRRRLTAPVSGRVGIKRVNVGDYVEAGKTLVSIHKLSNLFVNFSAPQKYVGHITSGAKVTVFSDNLKDKFITGVVTSVDPDVSMQTRNFNIQAVVQNPDELLRPGMFVSVSVDLANKQEGIVVPVSAINSAPYGDSVYIVSNKNDGKKSVDQQFVKVGNKKGDFVQILSGLNEGVEVVTTGLFKLNPGIAVIVNNDLAPVTSKNPSPEDT